VLHAQIEEEIPILRTAPIKNQQSGPEWFHVFRLCLISGQNLTKLVFTKSAIDKPTGLMADAIITI
jgi:hypothetical protein